MFRSAPAEKPTAPMRLAQLHRILAKDGAPHITTITVALAAALLPAAGTGFPGAARRASEIDDIAHTARRNLVGTNGLSDFWAGQPVAVDQIKGAVHRTPFHVWGILRLRGLVSLPVWIRSGLATRQSRA
jgi:hypothetical protein